METMIWVTFVGMQGFSHEGKKCLGDLLFIDPLPQCHNNPADFFGGQRINNRNNKSPRHFLGESPQLLFIVALLWHLLWHSYHIIGQLVMRFVNNVNNNLRGKPEMAKIGFLGEKFFNFRYRVYARENCLLFLGGPK